MKKSSGRQQENWTKLVKNQSFTSWSGLAFERLCFSHLDQIKNALDLKVIETQISNLRIQNENHNAQVDLLIERADRIIHICEIKFSKSMFNIDKATAQNLRNKLVAVENLFPNKSIFLTFITTFGVKDNEYFKELVQNQVRLDQLFT